jgi:hypothetical protein
MGDAEAWSDDSLVARKSRSGRSRAAAMAALDPVEAPAGQAKGADRCRRIAAWLRRGAHRSLERCTAVRPRSSTVRAVTPLFPLTQDLKKCHNS